MNAIRETPAIWLRKLADRLQPKGGGGGGSLEPL